MRIRAVIFDVYATLLKVGPPPSDADALWKKLFEDLLGDSPSLSRTDFFVQTSREVAQRHAAARALGISWPEIQWPTIVAKVLPEVARLPKLKFDEFIFRQMQIGRTLRLADDTGECLRHLHACGRILGIASNAQHYTLRELSTALHGAGVNLSIFEKELSFWSFQHGFSKPDPHVFQILTARLEARGLSARETLMVGDRPDNDIAPARAHGWQSWRILTEGQGDGTTEGDFRQLRAFLG